MKNSLKSRRDPNKEIALIVKQTERQHVGRGKAAESEETLGVSARVSVIDLIELKKIKASG